METYEDLPVLFFANASDWHAWLAQHHGQDKGVWLKFAKKGTGVTSLTYTEALDEALCFGWIDARLQSRDHIYYLQKFTPRRLRSIWSKRNTEKVAKLIADGRMQPAGLAQVEAAKKDGRWDAAYAAPSENHVPPEFQAALDANPKAKTAFEALNQANRYAMTFRIHNAKKPETKAAKIEKFIRMLEHGEKIHP